MARTPSTMLDLGTPAPQFALPDTSGKSVSLADFQNRPLLVMFLCNHCPFVKHIRGALAAFGTDYRDRGLGIVAINSNDVDTYPDDSPAKMVVEAKDAGYSFPYLFDATQAVARAYQAACTPDFFLFDREHRLVYRGQFDDSRPENGVSVTGADLRKAADSALAGKPALEVQKPSIGCNIKWKPGQEPHYFSR
jgi:peroxiredoxin